jgi:hypothetical protein
MSCILSAQSYGTLEGSTFNLLQSNVKTIIWFDEEAWSYDLEASITGSLDASINPVLEASITQNLQASTVIVLNAKYCNRVIAV